MPENDKRNEFGGYRIVKELASGSFGKTYLALSPSGKKVILKVVHPHIANDPSTRARVTREIEILRSLNHPQIAKILDSGEVDGIPFIVLEFINGPTLRQYIDENAPIPEHEALKIFRKIALVLSYLHQQGIVHRDVKPENIILSKGRPVLIDFGLARKLDLPSVTVEGSVLGTMHYIPPEVLQGGRFSEKGDIYALGLILYEMLTGETQFKSSSFGELIQEIIEKDVDCPSGVSEDICRILRSLLSREPDKRPTAVEILTEWKSQAGRSLFRRMPVLWILLAGFFIIGIVGVYLKGRVGSTGRPMHERRKETPARIERQSFRPETTMTVTGPAGKLHITCSEPSSVFVDGKFLGLLTDTIFQHDTGKVRIEFVNPRYGRIIKETSVGTGITPVSIDWDREAGEFFIKVKPWGDVYIDGRKIGTSPFESPIKLVGKHVVEVKHPVFGTVRDTIYLKPGTRISRTYVLR